MSSACGAVQQQEDCRDVVAAKAALSRIISKMRSDRDSTPKIYNKMRKEADRTCAIGGVAMDMGWESVTALGGASSTASGGAQSCMTAHSQHTCKAGFPGSRVLGLAPPACIIRHLCKHVSGAVLGKFAPGKTGASRQCGCSSIHGAQ